MRGFSDTIAPHHFPFESYGVGIQACATSAEIIARMQEILPPLITKVPSSPELRRFGIVEEEDGFHSVYNATTQVTTGAPLEMALVLMETQIRSWVAMQAPEMIFVHAGVVAHEGRAIVMPGDSFAGKTTLVEALVRRGAEYFSDEFAVFDQQGLAHPYPKALSMRSRDARTEVQTPVETIGGRAGDVAVPVEFVIVTYYAPGGDWQPRQLSPGEGALALLSRTVSARNRPEESLRVLTAAIKGATVLEGERGEADSFAELLLSGAVTA